MGVPAPRLPHRGHLAQAAAWSGWCCPRSWRPGRRRSRSCLAPPAGSTASRSAPRVGVEGEGPLPQASDPAFPRLARRGRQHPRLRKPKASPSSGLRQLRPTAPPPHLHLPLAPASNRIHLHQALALAEVLSSELPSHVRLGAAMGHTTQGQGLQFLHFQHLRGCLQELRGCCRERGIRGCQRSYQPAGRETDQSCPGPPCLLLSGLNEDCTSPASNWSAELAMGSEHRQGAQSQVPPRRALSWASGGQGSRLHSALNQWHDPVSLCPCLLICKMGIIMTSFSLRVEKECMWYWVKSYF